MTTQTSQFPECVSFYRTRNSLLHEREYREIQDIKQSIVLHHQLNGPGFTMISSQLDSLFESCTVDDQYVARGLDICRIAT